MIKKILSLLNLDFDKEETRLFLGVLVFYGVLLFAPNLKVFFSLFFLFGVFLFSILKDLKLSLWYLLISALPFSQGKTREYPLVTFFETGDRFSYSFYFSITPVDIVVILLLFLFLREKLFEKKKTDFSRVNLIKNRESGLIILLFLITGFISIFQAYFPEVSYLRFLILARSVSIYFLGLIFLKSRKTRKMTILLFLPLVFLEGSVAIIQYSFKSPLGRFLELSLSRFPYGFTASETVHQFRSAGTRAHPNQLGPLMTLLIPLVGSQLFQPSLMRKPVLILMALSAACISLLLSFSRGAWLITIGLFFLLIRIFNRQKGFYLPKFVKKVFLIALIPSVLIGVFFAYPRLITLERAFDPMSSGAARVDLVREAINLMALYPLGVGLENFVPAMFRNQATEVVNYFPSLVHNTFFIIGAEMGIVGLALFLIFVLLVARNFFTKINQHKKAEGGFYWGVFASFITYLLLSLVYPLFSFHFFDYFLLICVLINLM